MCLEIIYRLIIELVLEDINFLTPCIYIYIYILQVYSIVQFEHSACSMLINFAFAFISWSDYRHEFSRSNPITMPKEQKQRAATSLRKVDLERRVFNPERTDEFFVQRGNETLCLVCNDTNSTFKRSNLKGHFDAKHGTRTETIPRISGRLRLLACSHGWINSRPSSRNRFQSF